MIVGSLAVAVPASLLIAVASRTSGAALGAGVLCGIVNALLTMRTSEWLVDRGRVAPFVLSSVLRVVVFGIIPVGFALHGPWWAMATYFAGFFTPLALFARSVARVPRTD
jgi:hypothetical protein